jgi:nuclear RNA export factor
MKGDSVIITASPEDIDQIQKLDQFSFAGAILSIQVCEPPSPLGKAGEKKENVSKEAIETKDRFRAILAARYDAGLKLLNLSALGADPGLREMGVFNGTTTTTKIFPALMAVCDGLFKTRQEKKDAIVSVTLADNELADVFAVTTLAQTFPDIKNLDLSRNKFTDLKGLDGWRFKFRHLENLVLADNPLESQLPTLRDELLRRYPVLQVLNGIPIRTPEEITAIHAAAEAAKSPIPISGPDFRDVAQVGENFIRQFIPLYDNDRATLLATFYDAQSNHSVSVNMSAPRGTNNPVSTKPWGEWVPHSRNLVKLTRLPARMSRLYRGSQEIQKSWSTLPTTRHPDLQTQGDKYLIECHPLPGLPDPSRQSAHGVDGLIITIHGEFEEDIAATSEKTLRSFSRTFVLGPGAPGGPPIRIVSDMLIARAWAPLSLPQTSSSLSAPQPSTEQHQQQVVAMQLMERTGMTMEFAVMCLRETGWDLEKAFIAFNKTKVYSGLRLKKETPWRLIFWQDALPPHAFSAAVAR